MRLGLDIGKVIIGPVIGGRADTSFLGTRLEEAVHTPPADGAIEAIASLVDRFDGVWLVSKCGPSVQRKTRAWLQHHDFHRRTGLPAENLYFCLHRHEKGPIARELGLTHFVDDRVDCLEPMRGHVEGLFLFGEQAQTAPGWVTRVADWAEVLERVGRRP